MNKKVFISEYTPSPIDGFQAEHNFMSLSPQSSPTGGCPSPSSSCLAARNDKSVQSSLDEFQAIDEFQAKNTKCTLPTHNLNLEYPQTLHKLTLCVYHNHPRNLRMI